MMDTKRSSLSTLDKKTFRLKNLTFLEEGQIKAELFNDVLNLENAVKEVSIRKVLKHFFDLRAFDAGTIVNKLLNDNQTLSITKEDEIQDSIEQLAESMRGGTSIILNYPEVKIIAKLILGYLMFLKENKVEPECAVSKDHLPLPGKFDSFFEFCNTVKQVCFKIKDFDFFNSKITIHLDFIFITMYFLSFLFTNCLEAEIEFSLTSTNKFLNLNGNYVKEDKIVKYFDKYLGANLLVALMLKDVEAYKYGVVIHESCVFLLNRFLETTIKRKSTLGLSFLDFFILYGDFLALKLKINCLDSSLFSKLNSLILQHQVEELSVSLFTGKQLRGRKLRRMVKDNLNLLDPATQALFTYELDSDDTSDFKYLHVGENIKLVNYLLPLLESNLLKLAIAIQNSKMLTALNLSIEPDYIHHKLNRVLTCFLKNLLGLLANKDILRHLSINAPRLKIDSLPLENHCFESIELNIPIKSSQIQKILGNNLVSLRLDCICSRGLNVLSEVLQQNSSLREISLKFGVFSISEKLDKASIFSFLSSNFPSSLDRFELTVPHLLNGKEREHIKKRINIPIKQIHLKLNAQFKVEFSNYVISLQKKVILEKIMQNLKDDRQVRLKILSMLQESCLSRVTIE